MLLYRKLLLIVPLLFLVRGAVAQIQSGGTERSVSLDSVIVHGATLGRQVRITQRGTLLWDMGMMNDLPKILGNADPLHYAQMMPGVSTNGEYDAGLHILGCENSHNYITIDGAPIYGASHILGLFSVFNASHFKEMRLHKTYTGGASPDALGAEIEMRTFQSMPDSVKGEAAAGLISSQGTIMTPLNSHSHLSVSLRASYLNLLYGSFLKTGDSSLKYSFYDANVTYHNHLNDKNSLTFNLYAGNDRSTMYMDEMHSLMKVKWGNVMTSLKWTHTAKDITISNNIYFTRFHNGGSMQMQSLDVDMPSSLAELGNKFSISLGSLTLGMELSAFWIKPQIPKVTSSFVRTGSGDEDKTARKLVVYADYELPLNESLLLSTGIRGVLYNCDDKTYLLPSPGISLLYRSRNNLSAAMSYSFRHQVLQQTGMSSINTPLEFWLPCGAFGLRPQSSHTIAASASKSFGNGSYSVSVELYNKWLRNQVEYSGTIYSFVTTEFSLAKMLRNGKGHNYGASIILTKNSGSLTGWVSYALSRALRSYSTEELDGTFPSSHERRHELNAVATLHLGNRWDLGFTLVYASGTPFTAPLHYYIMEQRLMARYAEHNSNHLRPYFRLDGSVNYHFNPTRHIREHGLNLSIYNMTGRENDLFYYMSWGNDEFYYKRMSFMLRVLPSISYYMKF